MKWKISYEQGRDLCSSSDLIRLLLEKRGYTSQEDQERFLRPRLKDLCDPLRIPGMPEAVARVKTALRENQKILIYSDYDVDGMSSSALLYRFLIKLGALVSVFIPERIAEGYGLSVGALERALADGKPDLLVALDCGTTSVDAVTHLRELGIDVVILDHHELPTGDLPPANVLANPHRGDQDQYLATAGLVFKFCHAFLKTEQREDLFDLKEHLDFVALGTIADLVPLEADNRILVRYGLEQMAVTNHVGLRALMQASGVKKAPSPVTVGFMLGPRLNASGRLAEALSGWELLTTYDPAKAGLLASQLDTLNRERQKLEQAAAEEALQMALEQPEELKSKCLIVASRNWHQGVVGIVASRLQKKFSRPTIVISISEEGNGKGSARSMEGCSMMDVLRAVEEHLEKYGGHAMAAGLEVREDRIDGLRAAVNRWIAENIDPDAFTPSLKVDMELSPRLLTEELARELKKMEPFGKQNESPVFALNGVRMTGSPRFFGNNHLRFRAVFNNTTFQAVGFGLAEKGIPAGTFDLAGHWEIDDFNDKPCFRVLDCREAA